MPKKRSSTMRKKKHTIKRCNSKFKVKTMKKQKRRTRSKIMKSRRFTRNVKGGGFFNKKPKYKMPETDTDFNLDDTYQKMENERLMNVCKYTEDQGNDAEDQRKDVCYDNIKDYIKQYHPLLDKLLESENVNIVEEKLKNAFLKAKADIVNDPTIKNLMQTIINKLLEGDEGKEYVDMFVEKNPEDKDVIYFVAAKKEKDDLFTQHDDNPRYDVSQAEITRIDHYMDQPYKMMINKLIKV
jgi:hypothetical protein